MTTKNNFVDEITVVLKLEVPRTTDVTEDAVGEFVEWAITEMPGSLEADDWRRDVNVVESYAHADVRKRKEERGPRHSWESLGHGSVKKCVRCKVERILGSEIYMTDYNGSFFWRRKSSDKEWTRITPANPMPPCAEAKTESKHPEHEKLRAVNERSQACGEFLDWLLGEKHYTLGKYHEHTDDCWEPGEDNTERRRTCGTPSGVLYPAPVNVRKLLAEFFEISEDKLEAEKLAMLDEVRKNQ